MKTLPGACVLATDSLSHHGGELLLTVAHFLSAEFLVLGSAYVSYLLALRLLGKVSLTLRLLAAIVIGMWLATTAFHVLILFDQFRLLSAVVLLAVLIGSTAVWGVSLHSIIRSMHEDIRCVSEAWKRHQQSPYRWCSYVFFAAVVLTLIRAATLPPLGWDALTYHAVKAGMWVQEGRDLLLEAPGGWASYRRYPAGGSIFLAWAALPFRGDLLLGLVDGVQWIFLGLAMYTLGRQLGLTVRFALLAASYSLALPALRLSVGSGYIEPVLNLTQVAGLTFAIRFLRQADHRSLLLSCMALGVACGIKVTAIPVFAAISLATIAISAATFRNRWALAKWVLCGLLVASSAGLPWFVRSALESGYPLSPLPVEIAGLKLGEASQAMAWHHQRLETLAYNPRLELQALAHTFRLPTTPSIHLSLPTLIPLVIFPFALLRLWRHDKRVAAVLMATVLAILIPFYSTHFSSVRLFYGGTNSRFLLPIAILAVAVSFTWCQQGDRRSSLYGATMALVGLVHLAACSFFGWAWFEIRALPVWFCALLLLNFLLRKVGRHLHPAFLLWATVILPVLVLPVLEFYRFSVRQSAIEESLVRHERPRYWSEAVRLVDDPSHTKHIAVSSGPFRQADNWAMYLFLGRKFQNRLFYIPITESGEVADFGPNLRRELTADFAAWMRRIRKEEITHVILYTPTALEQSWIEGRPDLFRRLVGNNVGPSGWGLYQVKEANPSSTFETLTDRRVPNRTSALTHPGRESSRRSEANLSP